MQNKNGVLADAVFVIAGKQRAYRPRVSDRAWSIN